MKNKETLHTQTDAWRNIFGIANNEDYEKFGVIVSSQLLNFLVYLILTSPLSLVFIKFWSDPTYAGIFHTSSSSLIFFHFKAAP